MASELIAVDWGTTNFRAFRLRDGVVVERRSAARGILQVPAREFDAAFHATIGDWLEAAPAAPVIMSGMIGSRQGWSEAPYVSCPTDLTGLSNLHTLDTGSGRRLHIVPGLSMVGPSGVHEVMRGEETQVVGLAERANTEPRLFCLPGSHAKWVTVAGETIAAFSTAMTGEVFSVLCEHSILGRLMTGRDHDEGAFVLGLARSGDPGGLLHHLFGVRAEGLFGAVGEAGLSAYLSGILIGHDVMGMADQATGDQPVTVVGAGTLVPLYAKALAAAGRPVETVDGETAAVRGLWALAARAGLVQGT